LLPIDGEPLILRLIRQLHRAGIVDIVINLSYRGCMIESFLGDGSDFGVSIAYSHEPIDAPLDTGAGVQRALPLLKGDPFLLLSSDIWTAFPFETLGELDVSRRGHLIVVPNPPGFSGDFSYESAKLGYGDDLAYTYANIGIFRPEWFEGFLQPRYPLRDVIYRAIENDWLDASCYDGLWHNVGSFDELDRLRKDLV